MAIDEGPLIVQFTVHNRDEEFLAIEVMQLVLEELTEEERNRVLTYAQDRWGADR